MSNHVLTPYQQKIQAMLRILGRHSISMKERGDLEDHLLRHLMMLFKPYGAIHTPEFCEDLEAKMREAEMDPEKKRNLEYLIKKWTKDWVVEHPKPEILVTAGEEESTGPPDRFKEQRRKWKEMQLRAVAH